MANLNFLRGKYSDYKKLGTIVETNLYFTLPDDAPIADDPKSASYCLFQGNTLLACATHEADLNQAIADIKGLEIDLAALSERIDNISSELATYEIRQVSASSATIKEEYALIKKIGENEEQVGETVKIYKDSALQGVELSGQSLVFTYLTVSGGTEVVSVDVSSFLAENEFGNGLQVDANGVVTVKVAEAANASAEAIKETNKNFLEVDENGLAVRSVDTDSTILQKDIKVAGLNGTLGTGNYANGMTISAGTDIYTILQNILCQELYPTPAYQEASASSSMSNLTLKIDQSGTVEVGTLVTMTSGYTNGSSATNIKNSIVSGLENGYSASDDDSADSTDTSIVSTCTTGVSDDVYTISAVLTGFSADNTTYKKTVPTTVTGTSSAALAATALGCCIEGTNKIEIQATGASYSYQADKIESGYIVSNLGNTDASKVYTGITAISKTTSKPTKTANATVTGAYKYFIGCTSAQTASALDSAAVRALTEITGNITKDGTTTISGEWNTTGYSMVVAVPAKYKLATITDSMGNSYMGKFSSEATVSVQTGVINTDYKVFMYPLESPDQFVLKGITITKA